MAIPLKLVYRSRSIQYPLIAAINASQGWERAGIDLESARYVSRAANSDPLLINGECDFIFGSHISPYQHRFHGQPFVYLGQTVNWVDDAVASKQPIRHLKELEGKRLSEDERVSADRHRGNHPGGNHLLYLRRAGVDTHKIDFVPSKQRAHYIDVIDGQADAAFVGPPEDEEARKAGLHLLPLDPLPMVQASTMTTLWTTVENKLPLCEAVLKAVLTGIQYIKTQPEGMWEVMREEVAEELEIEDENVLKYLQKRNQAILEPRMYPSAESVNNAFKLAVMEEPEMEGKLNPTSLWDIHLLRTLEEKGFIDELYGGNVPGAGVPSVR